MKKELSKLSETHLDKNIVIVRVNLNLKLINGEITEDTKIKALIPTLEYLQKTNCKTIIISHTGEKFIEHNDELSFITLRFAIGRYLNKSIKFVNIDKCQNSIKFMEFGDILLLENLSFSPEEFSTDKKIQKEFIQNLAQYAEYYIDETFGIDQTLASVSYLPELLTPLLGINHEHELNTIEILKQKDKKDFISLIGGKSNKNKYIIIEKLIPKSEKILIGGEIALDFINNVDKTKELIKIAKENNTDIILPTGFIDNSDIDEATVLNFESILQNAKTLVVNGPLGIYNNEKYWNGTNQVFETATLLPIKDSFKVIGGEDTMEAVQMLKIKNKKFNHVTTAFSELIDSL